MLSKSTQTINLASTSLPTATKKHFKLILAPKDCFIFEIPIRRAPAKDLRRFLSLEIERLTPFKTKNIFFKYDLIKDENKPRIKVWIVMREHINHLLKNTPSTQIHIFSHDGRCLLKSGDRRMPQWLMYAIACSICMLTLLWIEHQKTLLDNELISLNSERQKLHQ